MTYRRTGILLALLLVAQPAFASDEVEIPVSQGLVEFHARRYPQALQRFEEALQADPYNPYTLYYCGVTRGRLGDFDGAITELKRALAARPDLDQAALELGVALVEKGSYGAAIPWLEQAQGAPASEADASLFLGVAWLQIGQLDVAKANLERAAKHEESQGRARYYLGVAAFRQQQWQEARGHFRYVADHPPDDDMGARAAAYLRAVQPYHAYGALGFAYDSNVALAPSDGTLRSTLGLSNQGDGRATIQAGADHALWRTELAQLWLGYEFDQSLQFRLTDFNLQDNRPFLQLMLGNESAQLGVLASYDYYVRETSSFFQQPLAMTWLAVPEMDLARTQLFYRFRWRGFYESPFRGVRNAFNNAVGITQHVYLGASDRYLWAGYTFDQEEPEYAAGDPFGYDGNQVEGGVGAPLPATIFAEASYTYRHESFRQQSLGRGDNEDLITVTARRPLTDSLDLVGRFFGDINHSSQAVFTYERYVGSVGLEARF